MYVSKKCCKDLLLINRFTYDHSLHRGRKCFCCYCLHAFITEQVLKHHVKDFFKINVKQNIKLPKKDEYVKFRIIVKNKIFTTNPLFI